jgi:hypothetical protein
MYFHVDYPDLNRLENQASSMITGINARPYFRAEFSEVSKDIPINSVNADYIKEFLAKKFATVMYYLL